MTAKKHLKRRIRTRMERTGETYMAAREHVLAQAPDSESAIAVEEMIEHDELAGKLGLRCPVGISSQVLAVADAEPVLVRIRDALLATQNDAGTAPLRALAFEGQRVALERPRTPLQWERFWDQQRRFATRMRAGIGGVSDAGDMLALHVPGRAGTVFVLCLTGLSWFTLSRGLGRPPRLLVVRAETRRLVGGSVVASIVR